MKVSYSIAVVIICYREGELIYDAIKSVESQTLQPNEIIIVNDNSQDKVTNGVCQDLDKKSNIKVVWQEKNGGPSAARNRGYEISKSEILVPLDADDLLPPNALQLIHEAFVADPLIGFVYGDYLRYESINNPPKVVKTGDISLKRILKARQFRIGTNWKLRESPVRRYLWKSLQGYDISFNEKDLHDLEFMIRVIASKNAYAYISEPIYIWRKYLGRNTQKVTPMSWYRIAKKYFDVYQSVGLTYRAYELLLLGAKWSDNSQEIKQYGQALKKCIYSRQFQLSSLIILLIPAKILQFLIKKGIKKR